MASARSSLSVKINSFVESRLAIISSRSASAGGPPVSGATYTRFTCKRLCGTGTYPASVPTCLLLPTAGLWRVLQSSSLTCDPGFLVLILDALPGAGFERHQGHAYVVFIDAEYHCLLVSIVVLKAYGEKVLPFLSGQQQRRKQNRRDVAAAYLLAILN